MVSYIPQTDSNILKKGRKKLEIYLIKKKISDSDTALINAVMKSVPKHITRIEDLDFIENDSLVIISADCDNAEKWKQLLSKMDVYAIYYIKEALDKSICFNKTFITSGELSFNSLFAAVKAFGLNKKKSSKDKAFCWGESKKMKDLKIIADRAKKGDISIHISGETGSGKTMLAYYIADGTEVIALNCACLDSTLAMDSLFGHVKGAFTGADSDRTGLCRKADGKILFLDELQDLPYSAQAMLLKVLESGKMRPLGSDKEISVHFKLITASSLKEEELEKKIRKDLLSRIGVVKLTIPPLRERKEDIPALINRKKTQLAKKHGKYVLGDLTPWLNHTWKGNIRELYSKLEYAYAIGATPEELGGRELKKEVKKEIKRFPSFEEILNLEL